MSKILESSFIRVFLPVALILYLLSGVGGLSLMVGYGISMFSYSDKSLEQRLIVFLALIIIAGVLLYIFTQSNERRSLPRRVFFICIFLLACILVSLLSPLYFIFYSFNSTAIMGQLHYLIYGKGIYGSDKAFELAVSFSVLFLMALISFVTFVIYMKRGNSLKQSFLSAVTFFWFMCFPAAAFLGPVISSPIASILGFGSGK